MKRYFTIDEADRLLPMLRRSLSHVITWRTEIEQMVGGREIHTIGDLAEEARAPVVERIGRIQREISIIQATGVVVKGLDNGLIDFWSRRDGQEVLLCWRLGEERVEWWHSPATGFKGRRRLRDRPPAAQPRPN